MRTKIDIINKWNQMIRNEIEKKNLQQIKKIAIKRIKTRFNIKFKWNQIIRNKIEEKN
jgi:hypothetical protein